MRPSAPIRRRYPGRTRWPTAANARTASAPTSRPRHAARRGGAAPPPRAPQPPGVRRGAAGPPRRYGHPSLRARGPVPGPEHLGDAADCTLYDGAHLLRPHPGLAADPRYPLHSGLGGALGLHVALAWVDTAQAMQYSINPGDTRIQAHDPAPDLNNLICYPFGFLWQQTGLTRFRDRGDLLFAGAALYGYWTGHKQFDQLLQFSFDYVTMRQSRA